VQTEGYLTLKEQETSIFYTGKPNTLNENSPISNSWGLAPFGISKPLAEKIKELEW